MSYVLVNLVRRLKLPTHSIKAILSYCADRAADDGSRVYPSQKTISCDLQFSVSTVARALKWLEQNGYLIRIGLHGEPGRQTVEYRVNKALLLQEAAKARMHDGEDGLWDTESWTSPYDGADLSSCQASPVTLTGLARHGDREDSTESSPADAATPAHAREAPGGDRQGAVKVIAFPGSTAPAPRAPLPPTAPIRKRVLEAIGVDPEAGITGSGTRMLGTIADMVHLIKWRGMGLSDDVILETIRRVMLRKRTPPHSFAYFDPAMGEAKAALLTAQREIPIPEVAPAPEPSPVYRRHERPNPNEGHDRIMEQIKAELRAKAAAKEAP